MFKRIFDIAFSSLVLLVSLPLVIPVMFLIWLQDFHSPFYFAPRVGKSERDFLMVKFRSMVIGADKSGVDSTSANDSRITPIGKFVRRYKLDELPQFWNVLRGDMSVVGPRPNLRRGIATYTDQEKALLTVNPGITDFASIVFSDEGEILRDSKDPDRDYDQLIRPWKSRLGIIYVEHQSLLLDLRLTLLTALALISRRRALVGVVSLLGELQADLKVIEVAGREKKLVPSPLPGDSGENGVPPQRKAANS